MSGDRKTNYLLISVYSVFKNDILKWSQITFLFSHVSSPEPCGSITNSANDLTMRNSTGQEIEKTRLCCQFNRLQTAPLPFERTVVFDFYDGPLVGIALCTVCQKCFYFKVLEWETYAFCRIFGFAPIDADFERIEKDIDWWTQETQLVFDARKNGASDEDTPIPESTDYVKHIHSVASQLEYSHLCVTGGYLGMGYWRKFVDADKNVSDWIKHIEIDYDEEASDFQIRDFELKTLALRNQRRMNDSTLMKDRVLGCLLGLTVGDATGAAYEGLPADMIYRIGPARKLVEQPQQKKLLYTDDTQMMISVAKTLFEKGHIDPMYLVQEFANRYEPDRGYGQGMRILLEKIATGADPAAATTSAFPEGSFGNGAAMRVAPVGLFFATDLDHVAEQAAKSARTTHVHPLGVDGAVLLAVAIALAFRCEQGTFNRRRFISKLLRYAETEEFEWQLETLRDMDQDALISFGNGLEAHRSVTTAIRLFVDNPNDYTAVISSAIGCGNDVDTIAAMSGAISGAYLGITAVPQNLLDMLENDHSEGRTFIEQLALNLWDRMSLSTFKPANSA